MPVTGLQRTDVPAYSAQVQRGTRAVNRKGFGYGGEDAYFYCWGPE